MCVFLSFHSFCVLNSWNSLTHLYISFRVTKRERKGEKLERKMSMHLVLILTFKPNEYFNLHLHSHSRMMLMLILDTRSQCNLHCLRYVACSHWTSKHFFFCNFKSIKLNLMWHFINRLHICAIFIFSFLFLNLCMCICCHAWNHC